MLFIIFGTRGITSVGASLACLAAVASVLAACDRSSPLGRREAKRETP